MSDVLTGGCFCGRIRYEARGVPSNVTVCHCRSCRRTSGAPMVGWMTVKPAELEFVFEVPKTFTSSPGVKRSFCPGCGTPITYRRGTMDEVDVTIASLDDPNAVAVADHVWVETQLSWVQVPEHLPRHRTSRPAGK